MQYATVELRLAGSLTNTVVKHNITPAEILIFRHIHGDESVVSIVQDKPKNLPSKGAEKARLIQLFPKYFDFIDRAFPGPIPQNLPTNFADVGVSVAEFQLDHGDKFTGRGKTVLTRGSLEDDPVFKAAIENASTSGDEIIVEVGDDDLKRLDEATGMASEAEVTD